VNSTFFTSIAVTGFAVAFLHAALPTHWLPFVLVGRAQKWSTGRTLGVTLLAGLGHVGLTIALGLGLVVAGLALEPRLGGLFHWVVGGLMVAVGLFYIARGRHNHAVPDVGRRSYASDRAAIIALVTLLTLSPCEAFLPYYLAGMQHGWQAFLVLSAVLMAATSAGMLIFTSLSLAGFKRLGLQWVERYEETILGAALIAVGVAVAFFKT
jgi:threonine/homoserine/homoserine lactone efflux protein